MAGKIAARTETRVPGTTTRGKREAAGPSRPGSSLLPARVRPMAKSRDGIPKAAEVGFIASSVASTVTIVGMLSCTPVAVENVHVSVSSFPGPSSLAFPASAAAERVERAIVRGHRAPGEAESCQKGVGRVGSSTRYRST